MQFLALCAIATFVVVHTFASESAGVGAADLNFTASSGDNDLSTQTLGHLRARGDDDVKGVYVCQGPGWSNNCVWQPHKADVCMGLPDSNNLAVGPDPGIQCMFCKGANCDDACTSGTTVTPGFTNWRALQFSTPPKSYKCHPCGDKFAKCGRDGELAGPWSPRHNNY